MTDLGFDVDTPLDPPPTVETRRAERRRRRRLRRLIRLVVIMVSVLASVGVMGAVVLSRTASGRELVLTRALDYLRPRINGTLRVGSLGSGGLLGGAKLYDVLVSDTLGRTVLTVDSIQARYSVMELLGGTPAMADMHVWSPTLFVERRDDGRINLTEMLLPGDEIVDTTLVQQADGPSAGFRVRGARIHGGLVVLDVDRDGRQRAIENIEIDLARVDIPGPESTLLASVSSLALSFPVGHGKARIADITGSVTVGPGEVTLEAGMLRLPDSRGRGRSYLEWDPSGWRSTTELDFERLALDDVSWLDPRLDHGTAEGEVQITADGQGILMTVPRAEVELGRGRLGLSGGLVQRGGTRLRDVRLSPDGVSTDEIQPWLPDSLPVSGVVSGALRMDGVRERLTLEGGLALVDANGRDTLVFASGEGTVIDGNVLEGVAVDIPTLDFGVVGAFVPELPLRGRGDIRFQADGALPTGMAVMIAANQRMEGVPPSSIALSGTLFGDTAVSVVDLEGTVSPLSFTMLRRIFPDLPVSGEVEGSVSFAGNVQELEVSVSLDTPAGPFTAEGLVNARDPAARYDVRASARDFRLSELFPSAPDPTLVSGSLHVVGRGLDFGTVQSTLILNIGSSTVGLVQVDTVEANLWVDDDGLLNVEYVYADVAGAVLQGQGGRIGFAPGARGEGISLALSSESILPLRPLFMGEDLIARDELSEIEWQFMELEGTDPDTLPTAREIRFEGAASGTIQLDGGIEDLSIGTFLDFEGFQYGVNSAEALDVEVTARGIRVMQPDTVGSRVVFDGFVRGDSITVLDRSFASARVEGTYDLEGNGRVQTFVTRVPNETYEAQAVVRLGPDGGRVNLDRLTLLFDERRWNLRGPASFEWDDDAFVVNDFGIIRPGSSGLRAHADGRLARNAGDSDFSLQVADLNLDLIGRLLQVEEPPTGVVSADLVVRGTSERPRWEGSLLVEDAVYRTLVFDRITANGTYAGRVLSAQMEAWTDDRRALSVEGSGPLDLRLMAVENRIPDQAVNTSIVFDGFPIAMLLGVLENLEEVDGTVTGQVLVQGRPSDLSPNGNLSVQNGTGLLTSLGVRLAAVGIDMDLRPDGTVLVEGSAVSGGSVVLRGLVDMSQITDPVFDLAFWPRELQVVDRRDMEAAVSGDSITLTGRFSLPLIQGEVSVDGGTVFIEEFQRSSEAVNFYDQVLFEAASAATETDDEGEVRARNPFMANLRVFVEMQVGRGSWLRSRDMNVETSGDLSLTFDRAGNRLILEGSAEVIRGTYSRLPRTFNMTEGVFRFVGTPGFNPDLSITAENRLQTRDGQPLTITADISGTLLSPQLTLSSDAEVAISEADLISYLLLGQPSSALVNDSQAASVGAGMNLLLGQVANQIGYLLAPELDFDYLSVSQAEQGQATAALGSSSLQVEAGRYVLDEVFLAGVYQRGSCADPTSVVSSWGVRVEVEMPQDVTLEGFLEDRCTREGFRGLGDLSFQLAKIWGFSLYREWGY